MDLVPGDGGVAMWVLAPLFLLGAVANAISRSPVERWWVLVSLGLALCCAAVAPAL